MTSAEVSTYLDTEIPLQPSISNLDCPLQNCTHTCTLANNANQMVITSSFPPGTPVWYNIQQVNEFTNHDRLRTYQGVVRSVSHSTVHGKEVYEVLRRVKYEGDNTEIFVETVDVDSMAYGSGCLVLVKTQCICSTTNCNEMKGEIIIPHFSYQNGKATISYTVKLIMNDGSILIEKGVSSERVQYRFGLDQLRKNLNTGHCKKMVAIRTGSLGLPINKRRIVLHGANQNLKGKMKKIPQTNNDYATDSSAKSRCP